MVAGRAALVESWLRRECSVQARSAGFREGFVWRKDEKVFSCSTSEDSEAAEKTKGVKEIGVSVGGVLLEGGRYCSRMAWAFVPPNPNQTCK